MLAAMQDALFFDHLRQLSSFHQTSTQIRTQVI